MRWISYLVAAAISIASFATPALSASWERPLKQACKFQHEDGRDGWTVYEVKHTIRCAVKRWPVPGGLDRAMYIADRESNFQQFATNPSGCRGIYQWADGTWSSVLDDFPRLYALLDHNVYNARSNVMYAIRYGNLRGWGPWGF